MNTSNGKRKSNGVRKMLKVICEMGDEDRKSLLISMPDELIKRLKVDDQGNVDTENFLHVMIDRCMKHEKLAKLAKKVPVNWDDMIFDSSLAVKNKKMF